MFYCRYISEACQLRSFGQLLSANKTTHAPQRITAAGPRLQIPQRNWYQQGKKKERGHGENQKFVPFPWGVPSLRNIASIGKVRKRFTGSCWPAKPSGFASAIATAHVIPIGIEALPGKLSRKEPVVDATNWPDRQRSSVTLRALSSAHTSPFLLCS